MQNKEFYKLKDEVELEKLKQFNFKKMNVSWTRVYKGKIVAILKKTKQVIMDKSINIAHYIDDINQAGLVEKVNKK